MRHHSVSIVTDLQGPCSPLTTNMTYSLKSVQFKYYVFQSQMNFNDMIQWVILLRL